MNFVRRIIPVFLFLWLSTNTLSIAQSGPAKSRWINGQKYILHKVTPKETWTSVSRKYHTSIDELQKANPGVTVLKIAQIINIPADNASEKEESAPASVPTSTPNVAPDKPAKSTSSNAKYHTVKKGETLYRIAKDNGLTVAELQSLNKISGSKVSVGQKLKVAEGKSTTPSLTSSMPASNETAHQDAKSESVRTEPAKSEHISRQESKSEAVKTETTRPASNSPTAPAVGEPVPANSNTSSGQKITENGVATWVADAEMNQNKFYALHRTAPVGTIIKVTNRMNNNSVYVKVIGVLPSTGDNESVLIKITQAAAQRIGALDQRFQAELSYASQ